MSTSSKGLLRWELYVACRRWTVSPIEETERRLCGYNLAHFKALLDHRSASILNVDVTICHGYDVALDVANLAVERAVSIALHGCLELQSPLAAGITHEEFLEYYPVAVDPLRAEMFLPVLKPDDDGFVRVPDRPGIGYELNMELLNRYRVG